MQRIYPILLRGNRPAHRDKAMVFVASVPANPALQRDVDVEAGQHEGDKDLRSHHTSGNVTPIDRQSIDVYRTSQQPRLASSVSAASASPSNE